MPLTLSEGFEVEVRYLSRKETEELAERCSRRTFNRLTGQTESVTDFERWSTEAPNTYIANWTGLTPKVCQQLGLDLDEEPDTANGSGEIPYDSELAVQIWRHAFADRFSQQIIDFSREILVVKEATDALKKNLSVSSSATSSNPTGPKLARNANS